MERKTERDPDSVDPEVTDMLGYIERRIRVLEGLYSMYMSLMQVDRILDPFKVVSGIQNILRESRDIRRELSYVAEELSFYRQKQMRLRAGNP